MSEQRQARILAGKSGESENLIPVFLRIDPQHIAELKFTLESYEGLGIVRTLDAERGDIVILALRDTHETLKLLLADLSPRLSFREIPPPESLKGDWLLYETYGDSREKKSLE